MASLATFRDSLLLIATSNFAAAVGTGSIIRSGTPAIFENPQLNSISAFLAGSAFGLVVQLKLRTKGSREASLFALLSGVISIALLSIITSVNHEHISASAQLSGGLMWLFFGLLCARFAVWFVARGIRNQLGSKRKQKLASVELAYYVGTIIGLLVWTLGPVSSVAATWGIVGAIKIDIALQLLAALVDFRDAKDNPSATKTVATTSSRKDKDASAGRKSLWLTVAIVALTLGSQIVIFSWAHVPSDSRPGSFQEMFSSYVIAAFYAGVALAAVIGVLSGPFLNLDGWGQIVLKRGTQRNILFPMAASTIAVSLIAALLIFGSGHNYLWESGVAASHLKSIAALSLIALAGLLYEFLSLGILECLTVEEERSGWNWGVANAYGVMAFGATIVLFIFQATKTSYAGWIVAGIIFTLVGILAVRIATQQCPQSVGREGIPVGPETGGTDGPRV